MELKELRNIVSKANNAELLNNLTVTINFNHISVNQELKGIVNIFQFFNDQKNGWIKEGLANNSILDHCKQSFVQRVNAIEGFTNANAEIENKDIFNRNWNNLKSSLQNSSTTVNNELILTYDSSKTRYLIEIFNDYPQYFGSAYNFLVRGNIGNLNSKNDLIGILLGYEFELQDNTEITQRRNSEKASLSQLRNSLQKILSETEQQSQEIINKLQGESTEYSKNIDSLKTEKDKAFNEWFNNTKSRFEQYDAESRNKRTELEQTYHELLRLKEPAAYWGNRAKWMNIWGSVTTALLIIIIAATALLLYHILTTPLEALKASLFKGQPEAVKWALVYATLISFIAYLVKTLGKLTYSFMHLARDAEERKQLTHVYLALTNETQLDTKEKEIVYQALFSRSETGLIKGDSAPRMPASVINSLSQMLRR